MDEEKIIAAILAAGRIAHDGGDALYIFNDMLKKIQDYKEYEESLKRQREIFS